MISSYWVFSYFRIISNVYHADTFLCLLAAQQNKWTKFIGEVIEKKKSDKQQAKHIQNLIWHIFLELRGNGIFIKHKDVNDKSNGIEGEETWGHFVD